MGSSQISTARDILSHEGSRPLALWVANDACPPAPGCVLPKRPLAAASSGIPGCAGLAVRAIAAQRSLPSQCAATYAADNNCYAPESTA